MKTLTRAQWQEQAAQHEQRAGKELADVIYRRDRALKHPVDDFLFHYYNLRPSQLMQWHPGAGIVLQDAPEFAKRPFYRETADGVTLDLAAFLAKRRGTLDTAVTLLQSVSKAQARFNCFGMHEWAMVYGLAPTETRHPYLPLRYQPEELARIVEEVGCRCTHFDAFRFFTPTAKPLNIVQPSREQQASFDQPGCLHATMDLYKWAGKLLPAVSAELLFESYLLARDIREVDMRASAYDLSDWGYSVIPVETAAGRAEYVAFQRKFAQLGAELRSRLVSVLTALRTAPNTAASS